MFKRAQRRGTKPFTQCSRCLALCVQAVCLAPPLGVIVVPSSPRPPLPGRGHQCHGATPQPHHHEGQTSAPVLSLPRKIRSQSGFIEEFGAAGDDADTPTSCPGLVTTKRSGQTLVTPVVKWPESVCGCCGSVGSPGRDRNHRGGGESNGCILLAHANLILIFWCWDIFPLVMIKCVTK